MIRESDPPSVEDAHTARADTRVLPRCPRGARLGAPSASRASSVTVAAMSGSESSTSELNPCAMWLWCRSCDARYCGRERGTPRPLRPVVCWSDRLSVFHVSVSIFDRSRVGRGATGDVPSRAIPAGTVSPVASATWYAGTGEAGRIYRPAGNGPGPPERPRRRAPGPLSKCRSA